MKFFKLALILSVFSVFACSPKYYSPTTQQVTLFEEEGDINLSVTGDGTKYEAQAAYAFTDRYAAAINFSRFVPVEVNDADRGSGYMFELGPGYYTSVGEDFIFEAYGMLGIGAFENQFSNPFDTLTLGGTISANALRLGVQPSFGYKRDNFSVALSSRIANLTYTEIDGNLIVDGVDQITYLKDNRNNFFIEPALTFRIGFEQVQLQFQYATSFNLNNPDLPRDRNMISLGINTNFNIGDF